MRIWHQSTTDLSRQPNYEATLQAHARRVCRPDTVLDVHGVRPGTYPPGQSAGQVNRYEWLAGLVTAQIIDNIRRAEAENYDAVAMSCFLDPGLDVARSLVDIPVLSMCESSLVASMTFGRKYGLICQHVPGVEPREALVRKYGFTDRVAAVVSVDPPISGLEMEAAYSDIRPLMPRLLEAAKKAADAGADLLIPAEGILNTLLVAHDVRDLHGLPVLDAYSALLCHTELAVTMRERAGASVSRAGNWRRPSDELIEHVQNATLSQFSDSRSATLALPAGFDLNASVTAPA